MHRTAAILLLLVTLLATHPSFAEYRFELHNAFVRAEVEKIDGAYCERYYAREGKKWILLLQSGSRLRRDPSLKINGQFPAAAYTSAAMRKGAPGESRIVLEGSSGKIVFQKSISFRNDLPYAHVVVSMRVRGSETVGHMLSTYSFAPDHRDYAAYQPLDFIFTPQLRPDESQVIADHVFRSPAFMMQKGKRFAALVPDLASIDEKHRPLRTTADLQIATAEKPFVSFGLQNWMAEPYALRHTHVYYSAPESLAAAVRDTTLSYAFDLFVGAAEPERRGFQRVTRFHWQHYGAANMQSSHGPQDKPFSDYIRNAWYEYLPQIALDTTYRGQPVTLLRQGRLAWSNALPKSADNDCWFNVWFNSLRTAYGMYLHGTAADDRRLKDQAVRVLNLALLAPQHEGIAPTIFYLDSSGGHWVADHAWGGIDEGKALPMFHNAWTCYWLLQWSDLLPERKKEIFQYTKNFADFLIRNQLSSGVIPSWYDPLTLKPAQELRDDNAETAGAALFLAEFSRRGGGTTYLRASERAMNFIAAQVLPERKWFDFETFFSCSRKPLGFFDPYTKQHPQNTLSMHQAAEAWLALYQITGNRTYRQYGIQVLDYLCLYQQVWSPKWLSCELFGGFGVQNTDGEWSDARQGYFAVTLMKYYEVTGEREYFERGIAALRAMFSLFESASSPRTAENYAHSAVDRIAGVTGINWGTGSSVVSIHQIVGKYGDAYINVKDRWGVGIDGCRIPNVAVVGSVIKVTLLDNVATPRMVRMKFDKLLRSSYTIEVNGQTLGKKFRKELSSGISVQL